VVEEGLSAFVFSHVKQLDFFCWTEIAIVRPSEDHFTNSLMATKSTRVRLSSGQGHDVFRRIHAENGGIVSGNRSQRRLEFHSLGGSK